MTVKVKATCAWCQVTVDTNLEQPIPKDWSTCEVVSPDLVDPSVEENFCSEDHKDHYLYYAPYAHRAASTDYTAKFYAEMNVLRKKEADAPREIVKIGKPEAAEAN